jgi:Mrp family chromosome partitioning ATPase
MRTITFYSYKGGVGRSLLVANAAKYLSILGKSVFALDLDLEAPGLHYKFDLGNDSQASTPMPGVVDVLCRFVETGALPDSLDGYTTEIKVPKSSGSIRVMRAGTAPESGYWRALSRVNWHDLFYGPQPMGVPFFLEIQQRIRHEFEPDFLLIDARTGITDMGGVATTLLPDVVVCLGLASLEHLEGLRAVMLGIQNTASKHGRPLRIVPVLRPKKWQG